MGVPDVRLEGDWQLDVQGTVWVMQVDDDPCAEVVVGQTRSNADAYSESYDPPERVLAVEPPLPVDGWLRDEGQVLARSDVRQDEDTGGIYPYGNFGQGVVVDVPSDLLLVAAPVLGDEFDVGTFPLSKAPSSTADVGALLDGTSGDFSLAMTMGLWRPARPGLVWIGGWDTAGDRAFAGDFWFLSFPWRGRITERDAAATLHCDVGDRCGDSATTDDDLDGDGVPDLVFGGYWREPGGRVGVVTQLREGRHRVWDEAVTIIDGEAPGGFFGGHVSTGDVDGDRRADLLVGAPYDGDGALYVFRGPLPPGTLRPRDADWIVRGAAPFRVLGQSADTGDLDGDGAPELIVAAPANPLRSPDPGAVLVFRGPLAPGEYEPADADLTLTNRQPDAADGFGWPVSAGDLDGDFTDDLVIGATYDPDEDGRPAGSVQVWFGRPDLFR